MGRISTLAGNLRPFIFIAMGRVTDAYKRLRVLNDRMLTHELLRIIREHEDVIVDMNTGQLMQGRLSNGAPVGEYRSAWYANFKMSLNPLGVVDLKLTGSFHNSFYVKGHQFPVEITATDLKTGILTDAYSQNIFGLTEENQRVLNREYILEQLTKYLRNFL